MDSEEIKQRKIRAILNKLTHRNLEKMLVQIIGIGVFTKETLGVLVSQIFDRAVMERTYCALYGELCFHLVSQLPYVRQGNEKFTFKKLLLRKCQELFERRENGKSHLENERSRFLGNIEFIGELCRREVLGKKIVHHCITVLLEDDQEPDVNEENIEALCILVSSVGNLIDRPKANGIVEEYFNAISKLSTMQILPSRLRLMLLDVINLRNNRWNRRKTISSSTPEEVKGNKDHALEMLSDRYASNLAVSRSRYIPATVKNEANSNTERRGERSKSTWRVCFREGYEIIEILSSSSDTDYKDYIIREGSNIIEILSSSSDKDCEEYTVDTSRCLFKMMLEGLERTDYHGVILEHETHPLHVVDVSKLTLSDHQEDDVIIIAERGQVACRDYSHSRHLCVTYAFSKTDHENHCQKCYCYVCDILAPCGHWGGETGHCHATDQDEKWNELRRSYRLSSTQS